MTLSFKQVIAILALLHTLIIIASNYLVQIPTVVFGLDTTYGAFSFPIVFLITDLTTRLLGKVQANKVIFYVMFPALITSYVISVLFFEGKFQGFNALSEFNLFVFRIAFASFVAYVFGQLLDISIFNKLRQNKQWFIAPVASSVFGQALDTLLFFFIAFYKSPDEFMANNWVEIGIFDYGVKLLTSLIIFVPIYGILLTKLQEFFTNNKSLLLTNN